MPDALHLIGLAHLVAGVTRGRRSGGPGGIDVGQARAGGAGGQSQARQRQQAALQRPTRRPRGVQRQAAHVDRPRETWSAR